MKGPIQIGGTVDEDEIGSRGHGREGQGRAGAGEATAGGGADDGGEGDAAEGDAVEGAFVVAGTLALGLAGRYSGPFWPHPASSATISSAVPARPARVLISPTPAGSGLPSAPANRAQCGR